MKLKKRTRGVKKQKRKPKGKNAYLGQAHTRPGGVRCLPGRFRLVRYRACFSLEVCGCGRARYRVHVASRCFQGLVFTVKIAKVLEKVDLVKGS
jgi:hypothetical protein